MDKLMKRREDLSRMFSIYRQVEDVVRMDKSSHFNGTELQLLRELTFAEIEGKKLISTKLADLLGVTRSSVSQMVNKLEEQGIVYRQADAVDRKIAYIQMTDEARALCKMEFEKWMSNFTQVVEAFGEEKLQDMLDLVQEFVQIAAEKAK